MGQKKNVSDVYRVPPRNGVGVVEEWGVNVLVQSPISAGGPIPLITVPSVPHGENTAKYRLQLKRGGNL